MPHKKAYIGFLPLTEGKTLKIKVWNEPWGVWDRVTHTKPKTVEIGFEHLYIIPAEAVHTELSDNTVEYAVLIITVVGGISVEGHTLNFCSPIGENLALKSRLGS